MGGRIKDLTGQVFGKLTVVARDGWANGGGVRRPLWRCQCECGGEITTRAGSLLGRGTVSCGCYQKSALKRDLISGAQEIIAPAQRHYGSVRRRAAAKGHEFGLGFDEFVAVRNRPCAMCGFNEGPVSVDRVDSEKGYTLDNVQPLCRVCQTIKSAFPSEFINLHIRRIVHHQDSHQLLDS